MDITKIRVGKTYCSKAGRKRRVTRIYRNLYGEPTSVCYVTIANTYRTTAIAWANTFARWADRQVIQSRASKRESHEQ